MWNPFGGVVLPSGSSFPDYYTQIDAITDADGNPTDLIASPTKATGCSAPFWHPLIAPISRRPGLDAITAASASPRRPASPPHRSGIS
jgi:hypothetical protein